MLQSAVGSQQGLKQTRVAALAPKHASGRARRALKCQASMTITATKSFMGQRLHGASAVAPSRRTAGRSGRLVVRSM